MRDHLMSIPCSTSARLAPRVVSEEPCFQPVLASFFWCWPRPCSTNPIDFACPSKCPVALGRTQAFGSFRTANPRSTSRLQSIYVLTEEKCTCVFAWRRLGVARASLMRSRACRTTAEGSWLALSFPSGVGGPTWRRAGALAESVSRRRGRPCGGVHACPRLWRRALHAGASSPGWAES